jgi:hypothetical protein
MAKQPSAYEMAAQPSPDGTNPTALISDEASVVFQQVKPAVIQPSQPDAYETRSQTQTRQTDQTCDQTVYQTSQSASQVGLYQFDETSQLWWSDESQLAYSPAAKCWYDLETKLWYDPRDQR